MTTPDAAARDRNAQGQPENARPRDRFGAPLPRGSVDAMADKVEPEDVCSSVEEAIERALELVAAERFFEAHEFFEWAWKGPATPETDRELYKGLAQLAVGYCHTQRGNATGARTLLQRGSERVRREAGHRGSVHGVDLVASADRADVFRAALDEDHVGPDLDFPGLARA